MRTVGGVKIERKTLDRCGKTDRQSDRYSETEDSQTDEHNLLHIFAKNVKHETPEEICTNRQTYAVRQVST